MKTFLFSAAALSAVLAAAPAAAVTFVADSGSSSVFANSANGAQVTFDSPAMAGFSVTGGTTTTGTLTNRSASPFGSSADNVYSFVRSGSIATVTSLAETFGNISVYLGSLDAGNNIDVLGIGGAVLRSFSGADLAAPGMANGSRTSGAANRLVTFSGSGGEQLTGLRFSTDSNAFEFDNIRFAAAAAVPEPGTWAMMILGFGVVGYAMRRRPSLRSRQAI